VKKNRFEGRTKKMDKNNIEQRLAAIEKRAAISCFCLAVRLSAS
jgi:hypothetical protein